MKIHREKATDDSRLVERKQLLSGHKDKIVLVLLNVFYVWKHLCVNLTQHALVGLG